MPDDGALTIAEWPIALAWNLRGDPAHPAFLAAAQRLLGIALPTQPNTGARAGDITLLSLGPRSWLCVGDRERATNEYDVARKALNEAGGALFDVSSSYVAWTVSGEASARVLNRGCPLDLHPTVFRAGHCAQSLLGHIGVLIYRPDERQAFVVAVARSFAADAWTQLAGYATTEGSTLCRETPR